MSAQRISWIHCKAIAHELHDEVATAPAALGQQIWERCAGCGMIRMDEVDGFGHLLRRTYYNYPIGYRDYPRLTKAEYRVELLFQQRQDAIRDREDDKKDKVAKRRISKTA